MPSMSKSTKLQIVWDLPMGLSRNYVPENGIPKTMKVEQPLMKYVVFNSPVIAEIRCRMGLTQSGLDTGKPRERK